VTEPVRRFSKRSQTELTNTICENIQRVMPMVATRLHHIMDAAIALSLFVSLRKAGLQLSAPRAAR